MSEAEVKNSFTIPLGAGNSLYYHVLNARQIQIYTNCSTTEITEDNQITKLTIGNYTLTVGDTFNHGLESIPSPYQVNYITKSESNVIKRVKYNYVYYINSHLENRTSQYILPCLGWSAMDIQYNGYLVNAYLTDIPNRIALLYRFSTFSGYGKLEDNLSKFKGFVNIDSSIPNFDLVTMEILPKYVRDVSLFKQGSYSKISDDLKAKMVSFHGLKEKDKLWQIIYKGKELTAKMEREWSTSFSFVELESKPNLLDEMLENQSFKI